MKRFFSLLALLYLVCIVVPFKCDAQHFLYEGVYYTILDPVARTCEVKSGSSGKPGGVSYSSYGSLSLPANPNDGTTTYTLVAVGNYAFEGCTGLTSVSIPNSVTSIGSYAFEGCTGLTSAIFSNGLKSISDHAFSGCPSLKAIDFPTSLTSIGEYAFNNCALTSLCLPYSLKSLASNAFNGCGLKKIAKSQELDFSFSKNVIVINYDPYDARLENGCVYTRNRRKLFYVSAALSEEFDIPETVTIIGNCAFAVCEQLPAINMGDLVETIGKNAFVGCSALRAITLGDGVKTIGDNAFDGCGQLAEITIPDSTTKIGIDAFKGCTGLKKVSLGKSVASIGARAWADCAGIETVEYWSENPCPAPQDIFKLAVYDNAHLTIPAGSMSIYLDVAPWYYFLNISEREYSGINTTTAEAASTIDYTRPYEVYTLSGAKLGQGVEDLSNGVYIVRQGSKAAKIGIN